MSEKSFNVKTSNATGAFYLACGFLAYYLRYGNIFAGNEIVLGYNVLFGFWNLFFWALAWVFTALGWGFVIVGTAFVGVLAFLWLCGLFPFRNKHWSMKR